jgi:hypothetical protein
LADESTRPRFAKGFPSNRELDALLRAFAVGDYAHVRKEGRRLAAAAEDEEVKRAAEELVRRTNPDPLALGLLALTLLLLVVLSGYYWTHAK